MISVVIPLYNEQDNIEPLHQEVTAALTGRDYELILVDDCSTDDTLKRIQHTPEVRVLEFAKNTGQSAAMYAGIYAARGEVIVLLDGDRQNDPLDIPRLLAAIDEGADLVCGYRANRKDTGFKRVQSRIANFVRSRFTGDGVRDTGCTLKAMRRECREALVPFHGMHRFIPALVKGMGYKLVELPVNHRPRVAGVSKYGFGNRAWKATCDMFAVKWLLTRQVRIRIKNDRTQNPRAEP
ncbi:MAG: dolichol-phosphate mannosyltransferase [Chthoniobacter sp.]|jgi:glycosyltransferase involved in cell wall biosynthesis|nr:dolichol-phosphate mannosyltransferase [Chthoniobacter sp.]